MVLNSVFINVDLPTPVSPFNKSKTAETKTTLSELKVHVHANVKGFLPDPHIPTQRILKLNPWATDLLTNWSGRLSKPTWPLSSMVRFSSFWRMWKDMKNYSNTYVSAPCHNDQLLGLNGDRIWHSVILESCHITEVCFRALNALLANEVVPAAQMDWRITRFSRYITK